jgi:phosphatidylglycerol:prolipoprotein diacylglycerol transferase
MGIHQAIARVLYGAVFVLFVPLGLVAWSNTVKIPLVAVHWPGWGFGIALGGLCILSAGMLTLILLGKGLPMNAFPPVRLVTQGIYSILPHPIYLGFTLICLGVSLQHGSATGLWLTTPIVALSCLALVIGYENPSLLRRHSHLPEPLISYGRLIRPLIQVVHLNRIWACILKGTEQIANSWREVRIGPIRIISHGIYGGLAGGAGAFGVVWLAGDEHAIEVAIMFVAGLLGAAVWAQLLEGSSVLLRPFGYYGGVLGVVIGGLALSFFGRDVLLLLAAWGCVGSFVQAIGRIRCLVQGCCHGRESSEMAGIRVTNEHSRVCAIARLKGRAIYPTQLYSIIGNGVTGALLVWLWVLGASLTVIGGGYLILSGIVRFMEEGYRGEPQTRQIAALPIYQWLSILSLLAGMLVMLITAPPAPMLRSTSLGTASILGVVFFFVCWFAYGIDFPNSKARYSRLSG